MLSFDTLYTQKHKISELSTVLSHIIQERSLCDLDVTCDLFFDYTDEVKKHLDFEERELYKNMLTHSDNEINEIANKYLSGSIEVKHFLKDYLKKWCKNRELRIKNHDAFVKDSLDVFSLVNARINDEVENLYPVVRSLEEMKIAA